MRAFLAVLLIVSVLLGFSGCKGGSTVDETRPVAEVKAETETMDVQQLRDIAAKYKDAILAKQGEVAKITARLKDIPVTEMLGDEAKGLKADIDDVTKSVQALTERFEVYYNKLVETKADVSGLEL